MWAALRMTGTGAEEWKKRGRPQRHRGTEKGRMERTTDDRPRVHASLEAAGGGARPTGWTASS